MTTINLGSAGELAINVDDLPEVAREYIFAYGLKQILNDAHASVTKVTHPDEAKRNAAKVEAAQARWDRLVSGEIRASRASGDPIEREMRNLAERAVKDRIRQAGRKLKEFEAEALEAATTKFLEANDKALREQAREIIEARKNKPDVEVDLAELGLA